MIEANRDEYGRDVAFVTALGVTATVKASIALDEPITEDRGHGLARFHGGQLIFVLADAPTIDESDPTTGFPYLTFDGFNWSIVAVLKPGDGSAQVRVFRKETIERSAQGHRMNRD